MWDANVYGDGEALERRLATNPCAPARRARRAGAIVAFLCSPQAGYLTGAAIPIDGGACQALF